MQVIAAFFPFSRKNTKKKGRFFEKYPHFWLFFGCFLAKKRLFSYCNSLIFRQIVFFLKKNEKKFGM